MKEIIFVGSTDPVLHQMYKDLEVNTSILYQRGIKNFNNKFLKFIFIEVIWDTIRINLRIQCQFIDQRIHLICFIINGSNIFFLKI